MKKFNYGQDYFENNNKFGAKNATKQKKKTAGSPLAVLRQHNRDRSSGSSSGGEEELAGANKITVPVQVLANAKAVNNFSLNEKYVLGRNDAKLGRSEKSPGTAFLRNETYTPCLGKEVESPTFSNLPKEMDMIHKEIA